MKWGFTNETIVFVSLSLVSSRNTRAKLTPRTSHECGELTREHTLGFVESEVRDVGKMAAKDSDQGKRQFGCHSNLI